MPSKYKSFEMFCNYIKEESSDVVQSVAEYLFDAISEK
jgi:hypothetical protein